MIAQVFESLDEAKETWRQFSRATDSWKVFECQVNGKKFWGVAYNARDFREVISRRMIREVFIIDMRDDKPHPPASGRKAPRMAAQKPVPVHVDDVQSDQKAVAIDKEESDVMQSKPVPKRSTTKRSAKTR